MPMVAFLDIIVGVMLFNVYDLLINWWGFFVSTSLPPPKTPFVRNFIAGKRGRMEGPLEKREMELVVWPILPSWLVLLSYCLSFPSSFFAESDHVGAKEKERFSH